MRASSTSMRRSSAAPPRPSQATVKTQQLASAQRVVRTGSARAGIRSCAGPRDRRAGRRGRCPRRRSAPPAPAGILTDVVLPAPLGPRKPKISPRGMASDRSATATFAPKRRLSPRVSTANAAPGGHSDVGFTGPNAAICSNVWLLMAAGHREHHAAVRPQDGSRPAAASSARRTIRARLGGRPAGTSTRPPESARAKRGAPVDGVRRACALRCFPGRQCAARFPRAAAHRYLARQRHFRASRLEEGNFLRAVRVDGADDRRHPDGGGLTIESWRGRHVSDLERIEHVLQLAGVGRHARGSLPLSSVRTSTRPGGSTVGARSVRPAAAARRLAT